MSDGLTEERLGQLRIAKLRALLGPERLSGEALTGQLGHGAAIQHIDGRVSVLVEGAHERSLGGVLTWATKHAAAELLVIVDASEAVAGRLARQAALFTLDITVERIVDRTTVPATPLTVAPPSEVDGHADLVEVLDDAGLEVVLEHGVIRGEVLGLEVARIVEAEGAAHIEVGVGRFDREISSMMFSNQPVDEALAKAVAMVRQYRRVGATRHPLRDLVPERWLRSIVLASPELVGATQLRRVDTTLDPANLRVAQPAAALATNADGSESVVVCTAGIDLDLVPLAADTRQSVAPGSELVLCGPARSFVAVVRALASQLIDPVRFVDLELPY